MLKIYLWIADLSVNDISSSNINNTGLIETYDLSVNHHASIFDLSVGNNIIIDNGLIETYDLSVNHHASIYDLSVGIITIVNGEFNDLSVNNHAFINDLSVGTITIVNGEFNDLSVNNHTSINDLSVNGFSEFTGNFLINNITGGSEAITIQTNHGISEKITIWNKQGNSSDSIAIKSAIGGVDISAGTDITFSASNIIMSNSDLSAGDISANNIQALGNITASGAVTGGSLTDGIASLSSGALSNATTVTASGLITGVGLTTTGAITATGQTIASGAITSTGDSSMEKLTVDSVVIDGTTITDGTATLNAGALTGLTNVTASGNVTALNFILDVSNGNLKDLSNNVNTLNTDVSTNTSSISLLDASVSQLDTSVNHLDASMAIVEKTGFIRMRKTNSPNSLIPNTPVVWNVIYLNQTDHLIGNGITHSGTNEYKIGQKGLYSYNIQLSLTNPATAFTVDNLELALTNGGPTPGLFTTSDINGSGSNHNGGFNKEFSEQYRAFAPNDKCFISGNGVGYFEVGDLLRIYLRWSSSTVGSHTFDINDPSGTIVTFALIQALE